MCVYLNDCFKEKRKTFKKTSILPHQIVVCNSNRTACCCSSAYDLVEGLQRFSYHPSYELHCTAGNNRGLMKEMNSAQ
jgi:hypothetical protein